MGFDAGHGRTRNSSLAAKPYRMELMALDVADAVRHAGGWMFDRVASGWTVIVILPKCSDPRSLRILGVQVVAPEDALVIDECGPPAVIATRAELHRDDKRIRRRVDDAVERRHSEVVIWAGQEYQPDSVPNLRVVHHRLSSAARAFKAQALIALGAPIAVDPVESFQSLAATSFSPPISLMSGIPADSA